MSVLGRKDTLVVLPMGFGKTLVCQVRLINKLRIVRDPVPAHTSIVVLVSPLMNAEGGHQTRSLAHWFVAGRY